MKHYLLFLLLFIPINLWGQGGNVTYFCPADSPVLHAFSPEKQFFLWYKDHEVIPNQQDSFLLISETGIYYATYIDSLGCESNPSRPFSFFYHPPVARNDSFQLQYVRSITFNPFVNDSSICAPINYSSIIYNSNNRWGKLLPASENNWLTYQLYQKVNEKVTEHINYHFRDSLGTISNTGTITIHIDPSCTQIYPNPTSDWVQIVLHNPNITQLKVFNSESRLVLQKKISNSTIQFSVHHLAAGNYFIRYYNDVGVISCVDILTIIN